MHPSLSRRLRAVNDMIEAMYEQLKAHSDEHLNRRPGPQQWSVLQVMHHLIQAETLSERYVRKKLSFNPELKPAGIAGAFRLFLVRINFVLPFKYKAPKGVGDDVLPETSTLEETIQQWRKQRESLSELLENLPEGYHAKALYKHPLAGKLSLVQMLHFFEIHIQRHQGQIERTLKG
ncbi:MAG TPA: DinB family protein [Saprospiraceae bacterium]|nr:DinB family protein [Saprospiraceae bacterium]